MFVFSNFSFAQSNCAKEASIIKPVLSAQTANIYNENLAKAKEELTKSPNSADSIIWFGRRTAYLGNYKEAIEIYSKGLEKFPDDPRFLRHRGHRYLTIRCFDDAIKDFQAAFFIIKKNGIRDEIEPDGLPNSRNVPTSSLWTNIYYHLGLAYYLKGDYDNSLAAFINCYSNAKSDDMKVAAGHWIYMAGRRFDKEKEVNKFINKELKTDFDIIENDDYYKLIKLYLGKIKAEVLLKEIGGKDDTLSNASLGYGLGNWYLYNNEKEKAVEIFRQITSGNQWASFGYIAAEVELKAFK